MSNKLYIIDISAEAAKSATKQSHFKGSHFAKYCLATIDEATNKMTTKIFTGDVLACIRSALLQSTGPVQLGNFRVQIYSRIGQKVLIDTAYSNTFEPSLGQDCIVDADVHGDGNNSLAKLFDSTHVVIANVIGQRAKQEIEYGCVTIDKNGKTIMTSWSNLEKAMKAGTVRVHNIRLSETGSLVRTNISNLGIVYLKVDLDTHQPIKRVTDDVKATQTKTKLLKQITKAQSPLMYELTDAYNLDALQYILKIHSQGEPVHYMMNDAYTVEQLRVLHRAYNEGIEIAIIADPRISARSMEGIRKKFEYNLWECIDLSNLKK